MAIVEKKKAYVSANIKVLSEDQVVRICVDCDFNEAAIDKELNKYEVDKKY
jgi:Zn ribbon nucleic-acid-binding protein